MRIMSYNTLFGGFDGGDDRRHQLQIGIVRSVDPDILLVQELKGFLDDGGKRLFEIERRFERRALVAPAPNTGQNTAIFIKPDRDRGVRRRQRAFSSCCCHRAASRSGLRQDVDRD